MIEKLLLLAAAVLAVYVATRAALTFINPWDDE